MSEVLSIELLNVLFNPQKNHLSQKKKVISAIDSTFQQLNQSDKYNLVQKLIKWIQYENNVQCVLAFVLKLKDFYEYLLKNNMKQKRIEVFQYLLQQESIQVRQSTINQSIQLFKFDLGQIDLKNVIFELLKSQTNYSGYDSVLILLKKFKKQFLRTNQYNQILNHPCFMKSFKTKKLFLLRMLEMSQSIIQNDLINKLLLVTLSFVSEQDQIIHCLAIKLRIILMFQAIKYNLISKDVYFNELKEYYFESLIRTKYTLISCTQYLVQILPQQQIQYHFEYLKNNINIQESEITVVVIQNIDSIFQFISKQQRKQLVDLLMGLSKEDQYIGEAISNKITELLQGENNHQISQYLKLFAMDQKDTVKLSLIKSFFKQAQSMQLFNFFKCTLDDLVGNKVWRIRLESLYILQKVMKMSPIQNDLIISLKKLLFDRVSRIRLDTITLLSKFINQQNDQKSLIEQILKESKNSNYLIRQTVLFFIKQTYYLVSSQTLNLYQKSLEVLKQDPIDNVKQIALFILQSY